MGAENPPCHPAARYNAILIIGLLDDQYRRMADSRRSRYAPATKALTAVVDQATKGNRFPPPVILGALIGLERHAQFHEALRSEAVAAMQAALLKLVRKTSQFRRWIAILTLGCGCGPQARSSRLGSVGEKNVIHNAIMQLASTTKSLDDRCEAAAFVEKLTYKDVKLDDAAPRIRCLRSRATSQRPKINVPGLQDHGGSGVAMAMPGPRWAGRLTVRGLRTRSERISTTNHFPRLSDLANGLK